MNCPACGHTETKVLRTAKDEDGDEITRHRECLGCKNRFYSYEGIERAPSTCDDEAVLREVCAAIEWLRPVSRNIAVVRDAVKKLERAKDFLQPIATSSR